MSSDCGRGWLLSDVLHNFHLVFIIACCSFTLSLTMTISQLTIPWTLLLGKMLPCQYASAPPTRVIPFSAPSSSPTASFPWEPQHYLPSMFQPSIYILHARKPIGELVQAWNDNQWEGTWTYEESYGRVKQENASQGRIYRARTQKRWPRKRSA